jgi:hypothetical protein
MKPVIRLVGIALLIGSALVPPWQSVHTLHGARQSASAGYHPLWNPPSEEVELPEGASAPGYKINVVWLAVQMVGVLAAMNVGIAVVRPKSK